MASSPLLVTRPVTRLVGGVGEQVEDAIAVEGALEIRIGGQTVSVTLRTPGHDEELALGFLAGEGILRSAADLESVATLPAACEDQPDVVDLTLAPGTPLDWTRLERHFAATAACGLCGRAHLASLRAGLRPMSQGGPLETGRLSSLPGRLRSMQSAFVATGGIHAAAWCDETLEPMALREDVGRHNAVDKVAGWLLAQGRYPAEGGLLWVSGRAGAEIALKAARARIPILAAVGAPSSLAIELAEAAGMTLVGFLRGERMNVYCGAGRIVAGPPTRSA